MTAGLTTRQAYRRGTMAGLSARAVETAGAFAQLWLLTRLLPKESFGRLVLALAIVQIVALLAGSGLQRLLIYRLSRADVPAGEMTGHALAGAVLGWGSSIGVVLAVLCYAAAPLAAGLLDDPALVPWLRGLAPLVPVTAALLLYGGWYQSRQRMMPAILLGHAAPVVATVVGLAVMLAAGVAPERIPIVMIAAPLLVLVGWWGTRPVNPLRLRDLGRDDAAFAAKATGNGLVNNLLRHADVLMLGILAGPLLVAEYAVALRLARLLRLAHDLLGPVFRPRIGFLLEQGQMSRLTDEYDRIRVVSLVMALVPAVVLLALGPTVLGWFGGYESAFPILTLLIGASITSVIFGKSGVLLLMAGHAGWSLATGCIVLGLNVALNLLLIPAWGAAGAAAATLAALLATQVLTAILLWRLDRLKTMNVDMSVLLAVVIASVGTTAAGLTEAWLAVATGTLVLGAVLVQHRAMLRALLPELLRPTAPHVGGTA